VDGIRFASKKEARRYMELRLLEKAGHIKELQVQPAFELHAWSKPYGHPVRVGKFTADFRYREGPDGLLIIEDVKGGKATRTEAYRLRKRIVEAEYGIQIREV
jgi:hypothetical protein